MIGEIERCYLRMICIWFITVVVACMEDNGVFVQLCVEATAFPPVTVSTDKRSRKSISLPCVTSLSLWMRVKSIKSKEKRRHPLPPPLAHFCTSSSSLSWLFSCSRWTKSICHPQIDLFGDIWWCMCRMPFHIPPSLIEHVNSYELLCLDCCHKSESNSKCSCEGASPPAALSLSAQAYCRTLLY